MHIQAAGGEGLERENGHMSQAESNERLQTAKALIADRQAHHAASMVAARRRTALGGTNKRNGIPAMFRVPSALD